MDCKEQFLSFLNEDKQSCEIIKGDYVYEILKIPYGSNLDILYCGEQYGNYFGVHSKLEYSGIYDKETQNLYDLHYIIRYGILSLTWKNNPYPTLDKMFQEINEKIQDNITNYVLDNKQEFYEAVSNNYVSNIKEDKVYGSFINNEKEITYQSDFNKCDYSILLEYLDKGDEYLVEYALDYAMKYKEYIGEDLIDIDLRNMYLNEIYQNSNHKIHKVKDIIDSLKELDCTNVHVFINKDGHDCNFKYARDSLLWNYQNTYLSNYYISSSTKDSFEDLFGKYADFHYEDITKIEFRNKIIYEDKNFQYTHDIKDESLEL